MREVPREEPKQQMEMDLVSQRLHLKVLWRGINMGFLQGVVKEINRQEDAATRAEEFMMTLLENVRTRFFLS